VARTHRRQPTLPTESITEIAFSTLKQTTSRLAQSYPNVQPFSETQARFWLKYMKMISPVAVGKESWNPNQFGVHVAQGGFDIWAWEAHYSAKLWNSIEAQVSYKDPDLDGSRKSEVDWCGWPDGGVGVQARWRGWDPEVGGGDEVEFLAEVAARELDGVDANDLNYEMRSHILFAAMLAAFEADSEQYVGQLRRRIVDAGRIDEDKVEKWVQEALKIMQPYAKKLGMLPASSAAQNELLRQILGENGQVFARWGPLSFPTEFKFELNPRLKSKAAHVPGDKGIP